MELIKETIKQASNELSITSQDEEKLGVFYAEVSSVRRQESCNAVITLKFCYVLYSNLHIHNIFMIREYYWDIAHVWPDHSGRITEIVKAMVQSKDEDVQKKV